MTEEDAKSLPKEGDSDSARIPAVSAAAEADQGRSLCDRTVVAVDPGRMKCGIAVVYRNGSVALREIVRTPMLCDRLRELAAKYRPMIILFGKGTGSKPLLRRLASNVHGCPIEVVDESHTSEAARRRFLEEHPPVGWQRLLPASLRSPDRPYDDYVAVILAERYWKDSTA